MLIYHLLDPRLREEDGCGNNNNEYGSNSIVYAVRRQFTHPVKPEYKAYIFAKWGNIDNSLPHLEIRLLALIETNTILTKERTSEVLDLIPVWSPYGLLGRGGAIRLEIFFALQKKFFAETNINAKDFKNKTLFSSIDTKEINLQDFAGVFPYTRGIRASMYTHKPWTIRQYAGFSTAKESNNFYKNC